MTVVAYEIVTGYQQRVVHVIKAVTAARLWARCYKTRGASFRVIDQDGQEFGTCRPGDIHGLGGIFTERCGECSREFRTAHVGAVLCPGCELVIDTEAW